MIFFPHRVTRINISFASNEMSSLKLAAFDLTANIAAFIIASLEVHPLWNETPCFIRVLHSANMLKSNAINVRYEFWCRFPTGRVNLRLTYHAIWSNALSLSTCARGTCRETLSATTIARFYEINAQLPTGLHDERAALNLSGTCRSLVIFRVSIAWCLYVTEILD